MIDLHVWVQINEAVADNQLPPLAQEHPDGLA